VSGRVACILGRPVSTVLFERSGGMVDQGWRVAIAHGILNTPLGRVGKSG